MAAHPHGKENYQGGRPPTRMMHARAFTGPSRLTDEQRDWARSVVSQLDPVGEVRTGAAHGLDTIAAMVSLATLLQARHVLYVPAAPHNDKLVSSGHFEVVRCPPGHDASQTYRNRNGLMLGDGGVLVDELVAFVFRPEFYRSGEWMTINIATRLNVPVQMRRIPS